MSNEDGTLWIVYNGEIYNYGELRKELGSQAGPWKSDTNTEVILKAYARWGLEAFRRFRGMFAFGIWDGIFL